ncbi:hypothetical protein AXF42_Ash018947 [Apostasia shenzhenica]|uniref:Uncharacterized protein n=1 Tax=Apostasia shenzhenica TaxID=1088818 RepID=A0A2I0B4N1_9ASPA|nr:hypothetical protein AXF42_Ash018947 [Apostasia shenzhenica]
MSPSPAIVFLLLALLLISPPELSGQGNYPPPEAVSARQVLKREGHCVAPLKMRRRRQRRAFGGREVEGCMPRGFLVPPSAPSRYVNYHTLGPVMCRPKGLHKP